MALLHELPPAEADRFIRNAILEAVHDLLGNSIQDLVEMDAVNSAIAITNAAMYSVDEFEIDSLHLSEDSCDVNLSFTVFGEQLEDRMFCGNTIRGTATLSIRTDADDSEMPFEVEYDEVTATLDDDWGEGFDES